MKGRPMVSFLAAFLLGMISYHKLSFLAILCLSTGSFLLLLNVTKENRHRVLWPAFFMVGFFCMRRGKTLEPAERVITKEITATLTGTVFDYECSQDGGKLYLSNVTIMDCDRTTSSFCNKLLLFTDTVAEKIGQKVFVTAKIQPLSHAQNPGQFDEYNYQKANGICLKGYVSSLVVTDLRYCPVLQGIKEFKESCINKIRQMFPEKEASVLIAIIFGNKNLLSKEIKELYTENGMAHLMAVSGLHISILGYAVYTLLRKLTVPVPLACILPILLLLLYGQMTGFHISTVRAACMFGFLMVATLLGRTYDSVSAMCAAAIIILIFQPLQLYQAGFLLSFLAVTGINVVYPILMTTFGQTKKNWLKSLLLSASAQITILPFLCYYFFEFSPYSIFLNLLLLPFCSILVISGLLATGVSFLWVGAGRFVAGIAYVILKGYELCIRGADRLPYHLILAGRPKNCNLFIYYLLLIVLLFLCIKKKLKFGCGLMLLLPLLLIVWPSSKLKIHALSVGQGDSIVVTKGSSCILIDGGSTSQKQLYEYCLKPYLKSRNIRSINATFISHSDADHKNGVEQLLFAMGTEGSSRKNYRGELWIERIYLPDVDDEKGFSTILKEAEKKHLPIGRVSMGQEIKIGSLDLKVLYPIKGETYEDANSESMVLWLRENGFDALFMGDLPGKEEEKMLHFYREELSKQPFDLLKVGHHGSVSSTREELLQAVNPNIAVISAGKGNPYGHPHKETLEKLKKHGCEVHVTIKEGMIEVLDQLVKVNGFMEK